MASVSASGISRSPLRMRGGALMPAPIAALATIHPGAWISVTVIGGAALPARHGGSVQMALDPDIHSHNIADIVVGQGRLRMRLSLATALLLASVAAAHAQRGGQTA